MSFAEFVQTMTLVLGTASTFIPATALQQSAVIAGAVTATLCSVSALVILDAGRRTHLLPSWSHLRNEVLQLTADRDAKIGSVNELASDVIALRAELDNLRAEKVKLAGVEQRREHEEALLEEMSYRLAHLSEERDAIKATRLELEQLATEKQELRRELMAIQQEKDGHVFALESLRERRAELEQTLATVKGSCDKSRARVQHLTAEHDALARRLELLTAEAADHEERRHKWTNTLEGFEYKRDLLGGEAHILEGRIGKLDQQRAGLEARIAAAHAKRGRLMEEIGRLEADRSSLWIEYTALNEKRTEVAGDVLRGEARLRELAHERDVLQIEIEVLKRLS